MRSPAGLPDGVEKAKGRTEPWPWIFTKEVDYRLAKWILAGLQENELVSGDETKAIWQELLEAFDPPLRSIEVVTDRIEEKPNGSRT